MWKGGISIAGYWFNGQHCGSESLHFLDLTIQPLDSVLSIEGTGGHKVPYLALVEVVIQSPEISLGEFPVLMIAVPDTEYHK